MLSWCQSVYCWWSTLWVRTSAAKRYSELRYEEELFNNSVIRIFLSPRERGAYHHICTALSMSAHKYSLLNLCNLLCCQCSLLLLSTTLPRCTDFRSASRRTDSFANCRILSPLWFLCEILRTCERSVGLKPISLSCHHDMWCIFSLGWCIGREGVYVIFLQRPHLFRSEEFTLSLISLSLDQEW